MLRKHIARIKKKTAVRGRPPALIITIVLHLVLFFVSGIFVAVQVVKPAVPEFQAKKINRPKMPLKPLQVPVKMQQQAKQPKMSQKVLSLTPVKTTSIVLPDLTGLGSKGGLGVNLSGISLAGSLGFETTQVNVFGGKSKGDKFLFVLDVGRTILDDGIGGIPAYKIIKNELFAQISRLPPTVLFNVIVFSKDACHSFSKDLCTANEETVKKLKSWLTPLNADKVRFGIATLGFSGSKVAFEPVMPIPSRQDSWLASVCYAVQRRVDVMYWLGAEDKDPIDWVHKDLLDQAKGGKEVSNFRHPYGYNGYVDYPGGPQKWFDLVAKAQEMLNKENKERLARGQPVKVIPSSGNDVATVREMLPSAQLPQEVDTLAGHTRYYYTANDMFDYIQELQKKYDEKSALSVAIGLKKQKLKINVIHFVPKVLEGASGTHFEMYAVHDLARKTGGSYMKIQGLDAIRSSSGGSSELIPE
ncbi:MAG: hypothetical protein MUC65_02390 [Pontiellaceae bacterium]|jgi:hypothetical protein|nr:hypothetical protein [Pontiellaceae bacterium]